MRRLLVVGKKLPRLPAIEWVEASTHNVQDYQGILLDCRAWGDLSPGSEYKLLGILTRYTNGGHPLYVILPDPNSMHAKERALFFVPGVNLVLKQLRGRTLRLLVNESPFKEYFPCLQGHEIVFEFGHSEAPFQYPVVDNLARGVCAKTENIFLFHPPARGQEERAFRAILDHFKPEYEEPELPPPPDWALPLISQLPGMNEIDTRITEIESQISSMEASRSDEIARREQLQRWAEMLWLDAVPLQSRVQKAFEFIGFTTESENPTGHTHDFVAKLGVNSFLIEVTGSVGSIKVDKGRELMQWILDSESPGVVHGVLAANAFRNEPPDKRPPTPDHRIFVQELEEMAKRFDFALLDIRELYKLVHHKLEGRSIDAVSVSVELAKAGLVQFGF